MDAPSSDPLKADTDNDGIPDGVERGIDTTGEPCNRRPGSSTDCYITNPRDRDTDGDGRDDKSEITQLSDPTVVDQAGKIVTFSYTSILSHEGSSCDDGALGDFVNEIKGTWRIDAIIAGIPSSYPVVEFNDCGIYRKGQDNAIANPDVISGGEERPGICTVTDDAKKTFRMGPGDLVTMKTDAELLNCDGPSCNDGLSDEKLSPGVDKVFKFEDITNVPQSMTINHLAGTDLCASTTIFVICPLCEN